MALKLCCDCKYSNGTDEFAECIHPNTQIKPRISLVTGKTHTIETFCEAARDVGQSCGPEANYWEAKGSTGFGF